MSQMRENHQHEALVKRYFELIRELRTGVEGAPARLAELWDTDGVFEFTGSPEVNGTFSGINAITTLYQNRFTANGMPLRLAGATRRDKTDKEDTREIETALGVVDTDVHRVRVLDDDRAVAGWATVVGTRDGQGFQISGSHSFTFKDDKIAALRVVVSPKAEAHEDFNREDLAVEDIGRLSLAAWMVV